MKNKPSNGFTLIELIVTLAVAGITLAAAVPSFQETVMNNRRTTQLNAFVGMLNLARSEAIKRGGIVRLCKSSNLTSCNNGTNWENGWLLFVDADNNGNVDLDADGNPIVIRVHEALANGVTLRGNNNVTNFISYRSSGFSNTNGTFTMCDSRGASDVRAVVVSSTGRPRSSSDSAADADSIHDNGANPPVNYTCP